MAFYTKAFLSLLLVTLLSIRIGLAQQIITIAPTSFDYGSVNIGDRRDRGFAMTNTGDVSLIIFGTQLLGQDAGEFRIVSGGNPTILSPGNTRIVNLRFEPDTPGGKVATFRVDSDDPDQPTFDVQLSGTGAGVPDIDTNRSSYAFGNVLVGQSSIVDVVVSNDGSANLLVTGALFGGNDPNFFSIVDQPFPLLIQPLRQDTLRVRFNASSSGIKTALMAIGSDDPNNNPLIVQLAGTGVNPGIVVDQNPVEFGGVTIGGQANFTLRVTNTGAGVLVISGTAILGTNADQFIITSGGAAQTINPGVTRNINLRFLPSSEGVKEAELQIGHSAQEANPLVVVLNGTGVGIPDIAVSPSSLNFGNVNPGSEVSLELVISNSGTGVLNIESGSIGGTDATLYSLGGSTFPMTLVPLAQEIIFVTFQPVENGTRFAVLTLVSNDTDESPTVIPLTGTGRSALIAVDSNTFDFGDVQHGTASVHNFLLANPGSSTLVVDTVRFSGPSAGQFDITGSTPPFNINAGNTRILSIRYNAQGDGPVTASATVVSNASNEPELQISLAGRSVTPLIETDSPQISFEKILVNQDSLQAIQLSNAGPIDLTVFSIALTGADSTVFDLILPGLPLVIPPSETASIGVVFSPEVAGPRMTTLRMTSNDFHTPVLDVPLAGIGAEIEINVSSPLSNAANATFEIVLPPGFHPDSNLLYYRTVGVNTYRIIPFVGSSPDFSATIPGAGVTLEGIEYYIEVIRGTQSTTNPLEAAAAFPHFLPVRTEIFAVPDPDSDNPRFVDRTFLMFSVPMELDDNSIESVLIPDYGPYNTQIWRLFRWQNNSNVEYPDIEGGFEAGRAFWLITSSAAPFNVENAQTRDPASPVTIILEPGWNQIGNPWNVSLNWPQAQIDPRIESPVSFDGLEFRFGESSLNPWEGYFVYNQSDTPLEITLALQAPRGKEGGQKSETVQDNSLAHNTSGIPFQIQLSAYGPGTELRDTQNFVGLAENARNGRDSWDWTDAPPVGEFVRLSIVEGGERFARNIKPIDSNGSTWDFEVETNMRGQSVTVELSVSGTAELDAELYVLDLDRRTAIDISGDSFEVTFDDTGAERNFRVIVGSAEFAAQKTDGISLTPTAFALEQNYPNPFNLGTNISYSIDAQDYVELTVYDLLGRRVRILVSESQEPGRHSVSWDGRTDTGLPAATGMYVYQLKTSHQVATTKMLLIR